MYLLTEFIVGIEYDCKLFQCLCPWLIIDNNNNNNKWEKIDEKNILKSKLGGNE